jgi:hypothetical protein
MIRRLLLFAFLAGSISTSAISGTIHGLVFSAAHNDSIVAEAPVALVYRDSEDQPRRIETTTDARGHFHFTDVSSDPSIEYILHVAYLGRDFQGSPLQFPPGKEEIEFNVLVNSPSGSEQLPSSHPPIGGRSLRGEPAVQDPLHTVLIVLWILVLFLGLGLLMRPAPGTGGETKTPPKARALIREIASLDNRYDEGIMGDEEYRKVRGSLLAQLRASLGQRGKN